MEHLTARSVVGVRCAATGQQRRFRVTCVGACCVVCDKCRHQSMVTPDIHQPMGCPCCGAPLAVPLAAHFACPATPQRQFAATPPFDIARFLAQCGHAVRGSAAEDDEVIVGFMAVRVPRPSGAGRGRWWPFAGTRAVPWRRLLAVACNGSLGWYAAGAGAGSHERVLVRSLKDALVLAAPQRPAGRICVSGSEGAVEADLGAADVARAWVWALDAQTRGRPGSAGGGEWPGDPAA